jgi:hypothetical protein
VSKTPGHINFIVLLQPTFFNMNATSEEINTSSHRQNSTVPAIRRVNEQPIRIPTPPPEAKQKYQFQTKPDNRKPNHQKHKEKPNPHNHVLLTLRRMADGVNRSGIF